MTDNSWYEKGELPPVGTECEYYWNSVPELWTKVTITDSGLNQEIQCVSLRAGDQLRISSDPKCFRPIKSDREKAIEEMKKITGYHVAECNLAALYDAGLRFTKNEGDV